MINKVLRLFQGCDGRVSERLFSNVMLLEIFYYDETHFKSLSTSVNEEIDRFIILLLG